MPETFDTPEEAVAASRHAEAPKAQAAAAQTPRTVRRAMLAGPREVCGVTLHPLSLDILWTLEAVGHPLGTPDSAPSADPSLKPLHIAQMIYAFAKPSAALELASLADDSAPGDKLTAFDRAAFAFIRTHNLFTSLAELGAAVAAMITEGLAAAPGAENPAQAAQP